MQVGSAFCQPTPCTAGIVLAVGTPLHPDSTVNRQGAALATARDSHTTASRECQDYCGTVFCCLDAFIEDLFETHEAHGIVWLLGALASMHHRPRLGHSQTSAARVPGRVQILCSIRHATAPVCLQTHNTAQLQAVPVIHASQCPNTKTVAGLLPVKAMLCLKGLAWEEDGHKMGCLASHISLQGH